MFCSLKLKRRPQFEFYSSDIFLGLSKMYPKMVFLALHRKDAKYMNKWAADPAENQT